MAEDGGVAVILTKEERAHIMTALRMWRSFLQGQGSPQGLRYLREANALIGKMGQVEEETEERMES